MSVESFLSKGKMPSQETEEEPTTSKKMKATFNRQYQEPYLKYRISQQDIPTGDSNAPDHSA